MSLRISYILPFGTSIYTDLIAETLTPHAGENTELVVSNIEGAPASTESFYAKQLTEEAVFDAVMKAEKNGFDAVIIGCAYDPGVRAAREMVDIPVVGVTEASLQFAPYFGFDTALVTDAIKAVPYIRDMVRIFGADTLCRAVSCVQWHTTMRSDPDDIAEDMIIACRDVMKQSKAESAIMGCTLIAGYYERRLRRTGEKRDFRILNPNTLALKAAESLADLRKQGLYQINRCGFYESLSKENPSAFADLRKTFGRTY